MKTALVLLATGFEEIEAVTIIDILRRAEINVTVAGLENDLVTGSHQIPIKPDVYYKDINANDFDLLVLPGGQPGSTNLKQDPLVLKWLQQRHMKHKLSAAICAAPTVFQEAGILNNINITSYPSEQDKFSVANYKKDSVVQDGTIITSRAVGTAISFSLKLVEEL